MNIVSAAQFGSWHNTFQALNIFSTDVFTIDNRISILTIFINCAKAFDTVNHKILLEKRSNYEILKTSKQTGISLLFLMVKSHAIPQSLMRLQNFFFWIQKNLIHWWHDDVPNWPMSRAACPYCQPYELEKLH